MTENLLMAIYRSYFDAGTNVKAISYNSDTRILRILFRSGYLYYFYNTSKGIYDYLAAGNRCGKKFWRAVAHNYSYRQINRGYSI